MSPPLFARGRGHGKDEMKFRNFLDVKRTSQQNYFKPGVELLYQSQDRPLRIAILPAYDPMDPSATGWIPAVSGSEESDFYCTIRAAKFVGHGNRRVKTAFLSPRTFDQSADDPYEAFYDYCCRSDKWSYLTKDNRGKRMTGEVEGAIFPSTKTYFSANVMDVNAGSRGGVFQTELPESVAMAILYSLGRDGRQTYGMAFAKGKDGKLVYGDITNPKSALVIDIAYYGRSYVARPAVDSRGNIMRVEIPETLLQHRRHMEEPGTFLIQPDCQDIVDRLAGMLRGYKRPNTKEDEIEALKEAMKFAYGDKYHVDEDALEVDPFVDAAKKVVDAEPEEKSETVNAAVERGVEKEKYTPVNGKPAKPKNAKKAGTEEPPGEDIDPSDIAAMRAMLAGGK